MPRKKPSISAGEYILSKIESVPGDKTTVEVRLKPKHIDKLIVGGRPYPLDMTRSSLAMLRTVGDKLHVNERYEVILRPLGEEVEKAEEQ
jgi:hypothetical protein